eukprot:11546766-Alexandrium_andersonii.AAC.1
MSASLVGSEMCIRDSPNAEWYGGGSAGRARSAGQHQSWRTARRAARTPVSYTHLTLPTICSV